MDQYVAGTNPVTGKSGWWSVAIGPGKLLDTDRFFIICSNILGGCMGTTGPKEINPETDKVWGLDFPPVTILGDMVNAQARASRPFGSGDIVCCYRWIHGRDAGAWRAATFPDRLRTVIPIATAPDHSAAEHRFTR